MDTITKICTKCNIEKHLSEFNKQVKGKYGVRSYCRECQKVLKKAYDQTESSKESRHRYRTSDKGRKANKRWRDSNKQYMYEYCRKEEYKEKNRIRKELERFDGNRELVLGRDNHKCVICESEDNLQVHHKDEKGRGKPKELQNNGLDNLITLCASCHIKQHNPVLKRWRRK